VLQVIIRLLFGVMLERKGESKGGGCLVATNVKPSVISRAFDVVDNLLGYSTKSELIRESVLKPHVSHLLSNLAILVERTKGTLTVATPIAQRQISILSEIAQYSTDSSQASTLLGLFSPLLRKPPKIVPEKVKVNSIKIISCVLYQTCRTARVQLIRRRILYFLSYSNLFDLDKQDLVLYQFSIDSQQLILVYRSWLSFWKA
jgi:hypothetical protein